MLAYGAARPRIDGTERINCLKLPRGLLRHLVEVGSSTTNFDVLLVAVAQLVPPPPLFTSACSPRKVCSNLHRTTSHR